MNTEQQLDAIVAQCKASLALAAKRTQGRWYAELHGNCSGVSAKVSHALLRDAVTSYSNEADAAYIAACAGAAEAGWRSTILACESAKALGKTAWGVALATGIIAAWKDSQ
jgi:hypothetical protein